ncbi:MAG: hypothetical protein QW182_02155 [Thermosphaera sp.]
MQLGVDKIYGVHYSRCHGLTAGLDLLFPPKKCPLDCTWCPMGKTVVKTRNLVEVDIKGLDEIDAFKKLLGRQGLELKTLYIWGSGDSLLNNKIVSVLKVMKEENMMNKIIVHTSGLLFPKYYTSGLFELVDEFIIPFEWTRGGMMELGWENSVSISTFSSILSEVSKKYPEKVSLEITIFKLAGGTYPSIHDMHEIANYMTKIRPERIYLKTVNRPVSERIHSVASRLLEEYASLLEKFNLNPTICENKVDVDLNLQIPNLIRLLYNHILRKPLSYEEIKKIYGDKGVISAENLVTMGKAFKLAWEKKVFYRGVI